MSPKISESASSSSVEIFWSIFTSASITPRKCSTCAGGGASARYSTRLCLSAT
jgi:hypothetical protein